MPQMKAGRANRTVFKSTARAKPEISRQASARIQPSLRWKHSSRRARPSKAVKCIFGTTAQQRVCASVKWSISRTEFRLFLVRQRANAFYDGLLDVIVRQIHEREAMRESIQHSVRMSA